MFHGLWPRYRRLTERLLWISCFIACIVCFIFVFLSLYYLEDHRDALACHNENKDELQNYKMLLKSYPTDELARRDPANLQKLLAENIELKRTVYRLAELSSKSLTDKTGQLTSWKERMLKYMQDIKTENAELKRTIIELQNLGSLKGPPDRSAVLSRSWQERSLKYINSDSDRKDVMKDSLTLQDTQAFLSGRLLSCSEISQIEIKEEIGRGYTKLTQHGVYNGHDVAVKSVGLDSTDYHNCIKDKRTKIASDCLLFSRYKVMKELLLYQQLNHPNIIKVSKDSLSSKVIVSLSDVFIAPIFGSGF